MYLFVQEQAIQNEMHIGTGKRARHKKGRQICNDENVKDFRHRRERKE